MINKKSSRVHLDTLNCGDSFHVNNSSLYGTVISQGAMGVRVILDGVTHYKTDGSSELKNGIVQIIANKTEVLKYEDNNSSKRLETITKMDNPNINDSGTTELTNISI
tara:strand:- start:11003 stop:11326 length:324 start_codon:yes stop_codon:yes gene_type:complete